MEEFLAAYRQDLHRRAQALLDEKMPPLTEELFALYEQTGNRLAYENVYFRRRQFLTVLGMEMVLRVEDELVAGTPEETTYSLKNTFKYESNTAKNTKSEYLNSKSCEKSSDNGKIQKIHEWNQYMPTLQLENMIPSTYAQYLKKLCEVMDNICAEETWALPPHVDRVHNPDWRITVDLFASETAQTLSELVNRLWDILPQQLRMRVVEEVQRRVLRPFFLSKVPYAWWEGADMNWNAVCTGAIGSACIHLAHRGILLPVPLADALRRICRSLPAYIDGFAEDGTCMEGLSYYTYGMSYCVSFLQELSKYQSGIQEQISSGDVQRKRCKQEMSREQSGNSFIHQMVTDNINQESNQFCNGKNIFYNLREEGEEISHVKLQRIAQFPQKCFFSDGRSISFSDGSSHERYRVGLTAALASQYDDVQFPNLRSAAGLDTDPCYRFVEIRMDLLGTEQYLSANPFDCSDAYVGMDNGRDCKKARMVSNQEHGNGIFNRNISSGQKDGDASVYLLPDAQWVIAESKNRIGFACKGGHNGEPHNHNDVGTFLYESGGAFFLTDLGAGEYTADSFGQRRYEIFCNSSAGHSVPMLGARQRSEEKSRQKMNPVDNIRAGQQCAGKEFCCGKFTVQNRASDDSPICFDCTDGDKILYGGQIVSGNCFLDDEASSKYQLLTENIQDDLENTDVRNNNETMQCIDVSMAIGSAYAKSADGKPMPADALVRTFQFDLSSGVLEIRDQFSSKRATGVENMQHEIAVDKDSSFPDDTSVNVENFITQIPPQVKGSRVYLQQDGITVVLEVIDEAVQSGKIPIRVTEHTHSNHEGVQEPVYAIQYKVAQASSFLRINKLVTNH